MTQKNDSRCSIWFVFALTAVVFLSGCVAGDIQIDSNRMSAVRQIAVHPVEPPALEVPGNFLLNMEKFKDFQVLGPGGVIIGGVVIALSSGSTSQEAEDWETYARQLESTQTWQPTEIVAQQVESHLKGRNSYDVQILLPMTKLYVDDKRGLLDVYGPIQNWYNGNQALRRTLTANADVVVEVGIWNYELAQGLFGVAVVVRAVDPVTGEILGRARAWDTPRAPRMDSLFADEAKQFKELFTHTTKLLTEQALRQLGL